MGDQTPDTTHATGAADHLTILRAHDGRRLTKRFSIGDKGLVIRYGYPNVKFFRVERVRADGIAALHELLLGLERDPTACVIRGEPGDDANLSHTRRQKRENGGVFDDVPRSWMVVDADGVPLPAGTSVIGDPADAARYLVDLLASHAPELEGVTAVVKFSASAGIGEMAAAEAAAGMPPRWQGVAGQGDVTSAHIWYWLATPRDGAALDRWARSVNVRAGHRVVDPATMRTVQPIYTAAPAFGAGLRDPLPHRTVLVHGSAAAAALDIPVEAPRADRAVGAGMRVGGVSPAGWLDRIGHPGHGFHASINSAIASAVRSDGPDLDVDGLVSRLRTVIQAAEPGGRDPAAIASYADPGRLHARIAWVVARERARRDAERAHATAAAAVPPCFPDRGVTLPEGRRLAAAAITGFAARLRAGEAPQLMLRVTVGGGKSEAAVQGVATLLEAARAGGGRDGTLSYLVPRHDLGGEIAARIAAAHPGLGVGIWRGMTARDPLCHGARMCLDAELPRAASAAGLGATAACAACPLRGECGYVRQQGQVADVWLAAHNLAFQALPRALPAAAAVVLDEAFWQAALRGVDRAAPAQVALSALDDDRTGPLTGRERDRLLRVRQQVLGVLRRHEDGGLLREALAAAGLTAGTAREWARLEWRLKPSPSLGAGMDRAAILGRLRDASAAGFTPLRPRLAGFVQALLAGQAARSVNATLVTGADLGGGQGSGPVVRMTWREDFAAWAARAPKLALDATTHPEVVRVWAPAAEVVDIEIAAPMQRVRQVVGEFGRSTFTKTPRAVARLADLVIVELAEAGDGGVLVVAQQRVDALLREALEARLDGLPARLHLAHHGAVAGMDCWRGVSRLVVVGRPAMNRADGERQAEIVRGAPVDRVRDGDRNFWPTVEGGIRRADGTGTAVRQPRHPDPLVEALRWSITEGAVLQAIGRARGVQRADPVHVTLMAGLALPLTVSRVTAWTGAIPDRLAVAAAEAALAGRALPLAPAGLALARPDLWPTEKSAERFWEEARRANPPAALIEAVHKGGGGFYGIRLARYRKAGARRWSRALVPLVAGRAALEALVGPVVAFEETTAPCRPPL